MRRSWTFTRQIGAALVASWGVGFAILVTSLLAVRSVHVGNKEFQQELVLQAIEVERLHKSFHAKVEDGRSFALSREPLFEEQMVADREAFLAAAERLRPQMLENPGAGLLEALVHAEREHEEAVQRWLWGQPRTLARHRADELLRQQVGPSRAEVETALEELARYSDAQLARTFEQEIIEDRRALHFIFIASVLGLLGMMALAWVLVRKLRPLHREARNSEQRFRLLVEGVQDYALCLLDAQGRVASWNPGAERIQGWKAEEVLGRPISIFYTPEAVAAGEPERELARAERDGRLRTEGWWVRKDGTRFWAEVIFNTLRDERGMLQGYAKVLRDVTERRRAMRTQHLFAEAGRIFNQLLEPERTIEELTRLIVPELADGCMLFMLEPGRWLRVRAVAHASPEKERLLRGLMERHPPLQEATYGASWVVRTGRSERIEKMADGTLGRVSRGDEHLRILRQLELSSALTVPLTVGEQTLGALVLLSSQPERLFSLSDQVFMEELAGRLALALDNARLFQEAQQALELIGIASHDLGNPLNALQLLLARLRRVEPEREPQRVREGLAAALRHSQRLGQLLHNLLDLSRLSSGKLSLEVSRVELSELVREVVERHAEQAQEAGCRVSLEADEAMEGWWDRLRLERVVTNLLSNALKFGRGKPVEIRLEQVDGQVRITVRDHGPGIPPEAQRRIFERFEREKTTSRQAGFGLGLYIVRQLVEAHGGTIRVESTPGEGAAFTVELPKSRHVSEESEPRSSTEPH